MAISICFLNNSEIDLNGTTINPDELLKSHLKDMDIDRLPEEFNYFSVNLEITCWIPRLTITFSTNRIFGVKNTPLWKGFMVKASDKGLEIFYAHYVIKTMKQKNKTRIVYSEGAYYEDIEDYRTEVFYIDKYNVYDDGKVFDFWDFERYFDQYHYNTFKFILKEIGFLN